MSSASKRKFCVSVLSHRANHDHTQKVISKNGAARAMAAEVFTEWGSENDPQKQAKRITARNTGPQTVWPGNRVHKTTPTF